MFKRKKVKHEPDIAEMTEDVEYLLAEIKDEIIKFKDIKPTKKEMEFIEHRKICEKKIMGKKD